MIIQLENVKFIYKSTSFSGHHTKHNPCEITALENINLSINKGEFVTVIGPNSSGKSTFAKLLNALLIPTSGRVIINNLDTCNMDNLYKIRQNAGMVFQNPENQIIGSTIEEDVAFGLENLGLLKSIMNERIEYALKVVHMEHMRKVSPYDLSGGQKQKLAIAGVIAMQPEIIVFDEPTALLDPVSCEEIIELIGILNNKHNITIILITQNMEEVVFAKRIIVFNKGSIYLDGLPEEILSLKKVRELRSFGLELPGLAMLSEQLINKGFGLKDLIFNKEKLLEQIITRKYHDRIL
ncbi:MAG: energy-coupling factor transporter ATPase [Candidatus Firestonebacteria bacterium]|nr:energy-coupling factor transporter ATPase [Candidatus Firestonebacteria bacterium]